MIDIAKYNVYQATRKNTYNAWHELVFHEGQILHCVYDSGTMWFARPINSDATPRMIYKADCRELTKEEKTVIAQEK